MSRFILLFFYSNTLFLFGQVIDFDHCGNYLDPLKIGEQTWMGVNLNTDKFVNGDEIPEAKSEKAWIEACKNKQPAWCYFENKSKNGKISGKLYNWYAVNDPRGLAPKGWRVPSIEDYEKLYNNSNFLENKLNLTQNELSKIGNSFKHSSGIRYDCDERLPAIFSSPFNGEFSSSMWWTCSEISETMARGVASGSAIAPISALSFPNNNEYYEGEMKGNGYPVRCITIKSNK
jgi:uncharacterized protein (TIGR02145 family)